MPGVQHIGPKRRLAWGEVVIDKLDLKDGDVVVIQGGKREKAANAIEEALRLRGIRLGALILVHPDCSLDALDVADMAALGWVREPPSTPLQHHVQDPSKAA